MMGLLPIGLVLAQTPTSVAVETVRMTPLGWVFMLASTISVTVVTAWCFWRVLTTPEATEHMHAPLTVDTHDQGT